MSDESESQGKNRRRRLSGEEHALWEAVAKTAKPLRKIHKAKASPKKAAAPSARPSLVQKPKPVIGTSAGPTVIKPKPSSPPLISLDRRQRRGLAKGRHEIAGRLDLHGLTQSEAHDRLLDFLHAMQDRQASFVLVITGKGRKADSHDERGVLRRRVPEWLRLPEFRTYVAAFEEAHIGHGGEGALYVRLRKAR